MIDPDGGKPTMFDLSAEKWNTAAEALIRLEPEICRQMGKPVRGFTREQVDDMIYETIRQTANGLLATLTDEKYVRDLVTTLLKYDGNASRTLLEGTDAEVTQITKGAMKHHAGYGSAPQPPA